MAHATLLFNQRQMRLLAQKKTRTWCLQDKFPFGRFKGKSLLWIAVNFPEYLEWWQRKKKVVLSGDVLEQIHNSKFLGM